MCSFFFDLAHTKDNNSIYKIVSFLGDILELFPGMLCTNKYMTCYYIEQFKSLKFLLHMLSIMYVRCLD